ncbi:hypothetical protein [Agromyces sp. SYSU T00194]|uniref:hypothetical protein n=1 Tax=Agromyces chitinivorans TaxID=3158560 RepID=UPI003399BD1E
MKVNGIECGSQAGNPAMMFSFDQELGNSLGQEVVAESVAQLEGYDRNRVSVVSGRMPNTREDGQSVAVVWLPISTPPSFTVNGDQFVAFPPIALAPNAWAPGPPLDESCELEPSEVAATFALTQGCLPVNPVTVTSTVVDTQVDVGSRTVEYAAPDTVTDDEVVWAVDGGFPGGQALLRDPFAQSDESRRAFFAALVIGGGLSFALLFVERILFHFYPVREQGGTAK